MIESLITKLNLLILVSHIIYFLCDIIAIFFVVFFYLRGINNLCNQIFILKKVFKVFEMHE